MPVSFSSFKEHVLRSNGGMPPALTIGLSLFLVVLHALNFVVDINKAIALHANSLFTLDREFVAPSQSPALILTIHELTESRSIPWVISRSCTLSSMSLGS